MKRYIINIRSTTRRKTRKNGSRENVLFVFFIFTKDIKLLFGKYIATDCDTATRSCS